MGRRVMNRRSVLGWMSAATIAVIMIISGVTTTRADDASFADGAGNFITGLAEEAINSLAVPGLDKDIRRQRFRSLMQENFAIKGIAKWALGRYWRRASADERAQYLRLFEDLMVISYADRFENYSDGKINVKKTEVRNGKDALVHSKLSRSGSTKPVEVIWRVRRSEDAFKVVDIMVEGLSMGLTQQKEFSSVIRKNGGKVDGLLAELRRRLKSNT